MITNCIGTAVCIQITSVSHSYIVIHFKIAHTIVLDQTIHYIHTVLPDFWISKVQ